MDDEVRIAWVRSVIDGEERELCAREVALASQVISALSKEPPDVADARDDFRVLDAVHERLCELRKLRSLLHATK